MRDHGNRAQIRFQFHIVRLKAPAPEGTKETRKFQFHIVRLKGCGGQAAGAAI